MDLSTVRNYRLVYEKNDISPAGTGDYYTYKVSYC